MVNETEKVSISDELIEKALRYIKEGRFKDFNDFFNQAVKLLIYSEDRKKDFQEILRKEEPKQEE